MSLCVHIPNELKIANVRIKKSTVASTIRYVIVGFTTFLLDYGLNVLLIDVLGVHYIPAGYLVFPITLAFNFTVHKLWTYRDVGSHVEKTEKQVPRYLVLVVFNMVANMVLMYGIYEVASVPLFLSRVLCTGAVLLWSFPVQRLWVYKNRSGTNS